MGCILETAHDDDLLMMMMLMMMVMMVMMMMILTPPPSTHPRPCSGMRLQRFGGICQVAQPAPGGALSVPRENKCAENFTLESGGRQAGRQSMATGVVTPVSKCVGSGHKTSKTKKVPAPEGGNGKKPIQNPYKNP